MINGGETADRMVDYSLRFGETAIRLSGKATISLVNYLTALALGQQKDQGQDAPDPDAQGGQGAQSFPDRQPAIAGLCPPGQDLWHFVHGLARQAESGSDG